MKRFHTGQETLTSEERYIVTNFILQRMKGAFEIKNTSEKLCGGNICAYILLNNQGLVFIIRPL